MTRSRLMALFLVPVGAVSLSGCGINSIPTAEEEVNARWADVQVNYQRRNNLIPNIVATAQGAAGHERGTLVEVTGARAKANQIVLSEDQLSDPEAMRRFSEAQGQVTASLIPIRQLQEAYPDLKAQRSFDTVMDALEGAENRIGISILDYNKAVQAYNTRIRTFPDVIGAKVFYGAKPKVPYQATTPKAEQAPKVDFSTK